MSDLSLSWKEFTQEEPVSLGRVSTHIPQIERPEINLDRITAYKIYRAIFSICEQMDVTVRKNGYSPIITEGKDYSCGIFSADARLVAQAANCPVHLASMHFAVESCIRDFGIENIKLGDTVGVNDPFRGGNHLPDLTLARPLYYKGEILMFAATRSHFVDVGGSTPGSFPVSDSIFSEGIRVPPVKYQVGDKDNTDVKNLLLANVRTPREYWGDCEAGFAAMRVAERRVVELADKYGRDSVITAMLDYMDHTEAGLRHELKKFPEGEYLGEDYIDGDGFTDRKFRIMVKVKIKDSNVYCDFSGTDPQAKGPINAVFGVTASSTINAFLHTTNPELMPNHGFYRPIHLKAPEGTIVNAQYPAPVVDGNIDTAIRILQSIWAALSQAVPDRIIASSGGCGNNMHGGGVNTLNGEYYVWNYFPVGGYGSRKNKDGWHATIAETGNDMDVPAEVFEYKYPWVIEEYNLMPGSFGHGKHRGGCGVRFRLRALHGNAIVGLHGDRGLSKPWGLFGGWPAGNNSLKVYKKNGEVLHFAPKTCKVSGIEVEEGDVVELVTPGGAGYGNPFERDPNLVEDDFRNGLITADQVKEIYGVVLNHSTNMIDEAATTELRRRMRSSFDQNRHEAPLISRETLPVAV